jgi:predicted  nucleic acid-binding Zn-ribbon protein
VSEKITENLDGDRSFEDRVFARFDALDSRMDALDSRMDALDSRMQVLESRAYDTKPIWENALKEIVDTRRELTKRLDRIEAMVLETRAGLSEAEDRLNRLETRPS